MIYLDHAASTPVDPRVAARMHAALVDPLAHGNPASSTHAPGRAAAAAIEAARAQVASLIGVPAEDLLFTSGATESDNLAVLGLARGRGDFGRHLVTSRTEHKAVLDACKRLVKEGHAVTWLEPEADGRIAPDALRAALRADTQLVSIMHANNETGVVQDVAALAAVCRERDVFFHTDAAQSAGKIPTHFLQDGIDLASVSAHKMYGPKGIGALYVAPLVRPWLLPLAFGGGQERGLRPGTLATHQIAGFGLAASLAAREQQHDADIAATCVRDFRAALAAVPGLRWNDHPTARLPGLVSLSVSDVEGESLLAQLPELALSSGAACDSSRGEPSYVLRALGVPAELAQSTLRISFGRGQTSKDAAIAAAMIREAIDTLRARYADPSADATWHTGVAGSQRIGTHVRCQLRVGGDGRVQKVRFSLYGCPHTQAVVTLLEARWPGLGLVADGRPDPALGAAADWAREVGAPVEKLGRMLVVEDAMRLATLAVIDAARGS